jgi:hypothetical protein
MAIIGPSKGWADNSRLAKSESTTIGPRGRIAGFQFRFLGVPSADNAGPQAATLKQHA